MQKDKVEQIKIGTQFAIDICNCKFNQVYVADFQTGSVYQIHDTSIQ